MPLPAVLDGVVSTILQACDAGGREGGAVALAGLVLVSGSAARLPRSRLLLSCKPLPTAALSTWRRGTHRGRYVFTVDSVIR